MTASIPVVAWFQNSEVRVALRQADDEAELIGVGQAHGEIRAWRERGPAHKFLHSGVRLADGETALSVLAASRGDVETRLDGSSLNVVQRRKEGRIRVVVWEATLIECVAWDAVCAIFDGSAARAQALETDRQASSDTCRRLEHEAAVHAKTLATLEAEKQTLEDDFFQSFAKVLRCHRANTRRLGAERDALKSRIKRQPTAAKNMTDDEGEDDEGDDDDELMAGQHIASIDNALASLSNNNNNNDVDIADPVVPEPSTKRPKPEVPETVAAPVFHDEDLDFD